MGNSEAAMRLLSLAPTRLFARRSFPGMGFRAVSHGFSTQTQPKTPMDLISEIPPIEVDGDLAICNGASPTSSHPTEYIQLNKVKWGEPEVCKYCGLRYVSKKK